MITIFLAEQSSIGCASPTVKKSLTYLNSNTKSFLYTMLGTIGVKQNLQSQHFLCLQIVPGKASRLIGPSDNKKGRVKNSPSSNQPITLQLFMKGDSECTYEIKWNLFSLK